MDKKLKLMNLLGVCLFAVVSACALASCSDNDTENPEGENPAEKMENLLLKP